MTFLVSDAVFTGAKEGLMAGAAGIGAYHFFSRLGPGRLAAAFPVGMALSIAAAPLLLLISESHSARNLLVRLNAYEFVLLYIVSVLAIYHASGTPVFPARMLERIPPGFGFIPAFVGGFLFCAPNFGGAFLFLHSRGTVLENFSGVALSTLLGVACIVLLFWVFRRRLFDQKLQAYLWVPQFLLFLGTLKLIFGGTGGMSEYSLIPAMQTVVMKFVHDVVHHTFTILLVPDHPLLRVTAWNFIGFFFGSNFGLIMTFILLLTPSGLFVQRLLRTPVEAPEAWWSGAERRLHKASRLADRRRQALMMAAFLLAVVLVWFVRGSEKTLDRYVPTAKPVVVDKGLVIIPLKDPTMNLRDGRIHKFQLTGTEGEVIRILILQRPDETLAVCLDACEICPPDGYGQKAGNVICLYCDTPIPASTLGREGGCNPIPLKAEITDRDIRIRADEIMTRWKDVNSARSNELMPRAN